MFTPFDTAHLTHRAARHIPVSSATREANRQRRAARGTVFRTAFRALWARLFAKAPGQVATVQPVNRRV
ncbi:hypothetical protein [Antarctobacter sp.]|uniref:hypothetical protein n=1 Tax=Antarctobacter sp. TaxID=1872577 RepID=UPI003A8DE908